MRFGLVVGWGPGPNRDVREEHALARKNSVIRL